MRKPSNHKAIPEIKCKVANPTIAAGNEGEGEVIYSQNNRILFGI